MFQSSSCIQGNFGNVYFIRWYLKSFFAVKILISNKIFILLIYKLILTFFLGVHISTLFICWEINKFSSLQESWQSLSQAFLCMMSNVFFVRLTGMAHQYPTADTKDGTLGTPGNSTSPTSPEPQHPKQPGRFQLAALFFFLKNNWGFAAPPKARWLRGCGKGIGPSVLSLKQPFRGSC